MGLCVTAAASGAFSSSLQGRKKKILVFTCKLEQDMVQCVGQQETMEQDLGHVEVHVVSFWKGNLPIRRSRAFCPEAIAARQLVFTAESSIISMP